MLNALADRHTRRTRDSGCVLSRHDAQYDNRDAVHEQREQHTSEPAIPLPRWRGDAHGPIKPLSAKFDPLRLPVKPSICPQRLSEAEV